MSAVIYKDSVTGREKTVYPASGSTENYPAGYFDDPPCAETIHLYPLKRQLDFWRNAEYHAKGAISNAPWNTLISEDLQRARAEILKLEKTLQSEAT